MRPEDLRGVDAELFEAWRALGLSDEQAFGEVCRSGRVDVEPFDALVMVFRNVGMSESAARLAAVGRDGSEAEARHLFSEAARAGLSGTGSAPAEPSDAEQRQAFDEAVEAARRFHGHSVEQATEWVERKVREEWAGLPPAGRVRELRAYAELLEGETAADWLGDEQGRGGVSQGG